MSIALDSGTTFSKTLIYGQDQGGIYTDPGWYLPAESLGEGYTTAPALAFACLRSTTNGVGHDTCCTADGYAVMYFAGGLWAPEDFKGSPDGFFVATGECRPVTIAPAETFGAGSFAKLIDSKMGGVWRAGCSTDTFLTFRMAYYRTTYPNYPTSPSFAVAAESLGTATISGHLCVPDPCNPPPDKARYWYVLKRAYPYIEKVAGGSTDDTGDRAPKDWLSGPYFKTYVRDSGPDDDGECTGHFADVPDPDPFSPSWCVEYQDQTDDGTEVGQPYQGCYTNGASGITCRNWDAVVTRDGATAGPDVGPPTVETDLELDPDREAPEGATKRKRTYLDGPWPAGRWCCLSCPECGRMSKGRKLAVYDFPGLRWVSTDYGKKPGAADDSYENQQFLRCSLGWSWNTPDVDRYGGGRGFSASRKQAFRQLLGAPAEVVIGDDDSGGGGSPSMSPPVLGQVNEHPKGWGTRVGDLPGSDTPPGYDLPTRWWVLPSYDDDAGRLVVQELPRLGYPSAWAAGPFDSTDITDEGRAAGQAAAIGAANGDAWWCVEWQDRDASGNPVGLPYKGCARQRDLPLPPIPEPPIPGGTPPPRWRIGISLDGADLNPDHVSLPEATQRTATLLDGPWIGVTGSDMKTRCRNNCIPCVDRLDSVTALAAKGVPSFWYLVLQGGNLESVKSEVRPDASQFVAGPFITQKRAFDYVGIGA